MPSFVRSAGSTLLGVIDPPRLRAFLIGSCSPDFRLALCLCLPAALIGLILRGYLLAHMPAAFVHNDTAAILETAQRFVAHGTFSLDPKKTFLAPALACIPAALHLPVLPFLAVVQHFLGLVAIFLCGLLTFGWLRHWRILIIPITLAAAINPALLWYEHTALAESLAIFGVLALAAAATLFWHRPNRYSLALLLAAYVILAGARPEGHLFGLFVLALVLRAWWRQPCVRAAGVLTMVCVAVVFALTRTGQSGLLLFTSVLHLTPSHLVASPGVAELVQPLVPIAKEGMTDPHPPRLVPLRKELQRRMSAAGLDPNATGQRAGLEILLRQPHALPSLALRKFVVGHRELPSGTFNDYAIAGQLDALTNGGEDVSRGALRFSDLMWGQPLTDADSALAYLRSHYREIPGDWLTRLLTGWQWTTTRPLLPVALPGSTVQDVSLPGLPWLYAAALAGLLSLAARERPLGFHQLWGAFLIGLFILIMVTANVRARFRMLFEPFWILYALALVDSLWILASRWRARSQ